jgi:hypothetical protein
LIVALPSEEPVVLVSWTTPFVPEPPLLSTKKVVLIPLLPAMAFGREVVPPPSKSSSILGVMDGSLMVISPDPVAALLVTLRMVFVPPLRVIPEVLEEEFARISVPPETVVTPV